MTATQERVPNLSDPDGITTGVPDFVPNYFYEPNGPSADIFTVVPKPVDFDESLLTGLPSRRADVRIVETTVESVPRSTRRFGLSAGSVARGLSTLGRWRRALTTTSEVADENPVANDETFNEGLIGARALPVPEGFDPFAVSHSTNPDSEVSAVVSLPPADIFGTESTPSHEEIARQRRQDAIDRKIANAHLGLRALVMTATTSFGPASGGYHAPSYHGVRPEKAGPVLAFDVSQDIIRVLEARGNYRAADEEAQEAALLAAHSPRHYRQVQTAQAFEVPLGITATDAEPVDDISDTHAPTPDGRWSLRQSGLQTEADTLGEPLVQRAFRGLLDRMMRRNRI